MVYIIYIIFVYMEKEKQIYEDPKVLNIPEQLAIICLGNEDMYSMLRLSYLFKHYSKNLDGRLVQPTKDKIRDMCSCSDAKACKLLKMAKKDKFFFRYDAKNDVLTARNVKKPYTKKYIHPEKGESWRINVIQISRYNGNEKIKLTDQGLKKEIEKMLLLESIKRCEKNYKSLFHEHQSSMHVAFKYKCGIHRTNLFFPSHEQMCKIIGAKNKKYVYRLLKELIVEGRIEKVKRNQLIYIGNHRSDGTEEVERRSKMFHTVVVDKRTGSAYAASPNVYLTTEKGRKGIRNIILNHEGRMTVYYKKSEAEKAQKELAKRIFAQRYDTCCDDDKNDGK